MPAERRDSPQRIRRRSLSLSLSHSLPFPPYTPSPFLSLSLPPSSVRLTPISSGLLCSAGPLVGLGPGRASGSRRRPSRALARGGAGRAFAARMGSRWLRAAAAPRAMAHTRHPAGSPGSGSGAARRRDAAPAREAAREAGTDCVPSRAPGTRRVRDARGGEISPLRLQLPLEAVAGGGDSVAATGRHSLRAPRAGGRGGALRGHLPPMTHDSGSTGRRCCAKAAPSRDAPSGSGHSPARRACRCTEAALRSPVTDSA